jgi:deazaflavin-dependent oxidoreductase (nitroreductase family)
VASPPRWLVRAFTTAHVGLFRLSGGRRFNRSPFGSPILLLTTTGRTSGRQRTVPVAYLRDGDDLLVIGSGGGADSHPAWVVNLRANPAAEVDLNGGRRRVRAMQTKGAERERLWAEVKTRYPSFARYERRTTRQIPVIRLRPEPISGG